MLYAYMASVLAGKSSALVKREKKSSFIIRLSTLAKTEMIYQKNVGAQVAMNFT